MFAWYWLADLCEQEKMSVASRPRNTSPVGWASAPDRETLRQLAGRQRATPARAILAGQQTG
jgi:hypothetical protein